LASAWTSRHTRRLPVGGQSIRSCAVLLPGRPGQVAEQFACGPDPKRHLKVAQEFVGAGFDHLVAMNAGPDPDGFLDFFARELAAPMRALTPAEKSPGQ
jgi:hypothetical protein